MGVMFYFNIEDVIRIEAGNINNWYKEIFYRL